MVIDVDMLRVHPEKAKKRCVFVYNHNTQKT